MILVDVNVLVYAFRSAAPEHPRYRAWLTAMVESPSAYASSDHVLAGFLRVATGIRVFDPPTPIAVALDFAAAFRERSNAVPVAPGARHWSIFDALCRKAGARGNLVPDAWLAALAIESGCEFVTADRDYARFPGLRWHHPLE